MPVGWASMDWSKIPDPETGHPTPGGSGWYRTHLPHRALLDAGVPSVIGRLIFSPDLGRFGVREWDGTDHFDVNLVVLQRWMLRDLPGDMEVARSNGQLVANEVDDWFFGLATQNLASRALTADPRSNVTHYRRVLAASDFTIASTPYLANRLRSFLPDVRVVRNHIDLDRWPVTPQRDRPVLGWAGAIPWRSGDLETLRGVLPALCRRFDISFHHSGHIGGDWPPAYEVLGLDPADPRHTATPMAPVTEWPAQFCHFDVGIVPLSDRPFNHAKCLDGSTLVATRRGILAARDLKAGDEVWLGQWRPVEAVATEPAVPGVALTTDSGRRLAVTPEHRLWANGSWVHAGDLRPGDRIQLASDTFGDLENPVLVPWPAEGRLSRTAEAEARYLAFLGAEDGPVVRITSRWGRLLGMFVGNGSVGQGTSVTISFNGIDADLIKLACDDWTAVGLAPSTENVSTWGGEVLKRRSVRVASAHLVRFLHAVGVVESEPGNVKKARQRRRFRVPECIWRSPRPIAAAFLAGLFETDGTVPKRATGVELSTKSLDLARDVQRLLVAFGIVATVVPQRVAAYPDRTYWKVKLNRAATDVFAKEIGFLSRRKRDRLQALVTRPHSNAYRPMSWEEVVTEVSPCFVEPVDLQVEGEAFAAAGFLSHNSAVKGLEYVAAGKPFVAQAAPEYEWLAKLGIGRVAKRARDWQHHLSELLTMSAAERQAEADLNRQRVADAQLTTDHLAEHWLDAVVGTPVRS